MTLQRVCMCVWVLSTLACSDGAAAPLERPSPTTEAPAANVLHVAGAVQVTPTAGAPFAAAPKQDLVESDLLTPAEGAFVVVLLKNGHLVRVDDVGPLKVGQILLLGAPPTTRDVASQLAALLDPGDAVPTGAVVERAAAWRHMKRAGETAGAEKKKDRAREESVASPSPLANVGGGVRSGEGVTPPPGNGPQRPRQVSKSAPLPPMEQTKPMTPAPATANALPPPPEADVADIADTPSKAEAPTEPGLRAAFGAKPTTGTALAAVPFLTGGVAVCLEETARAHGLAFDQVVLLVEVKSGVVKRVRLEGALPAPACAGPLAGLPVAVPADGWLVLRLAR